MVYISMGFGNPYGDTYNADVAVGWVRKLAGLGIKTIAMADTVGVAKPDNISYIFNSLIPEFKDISIGAHFHTAPDKWEEKISAAYAAGCRRYDSALKGIGGCPMAEDKLVGNMATENVINWCEQNNIPLSINREAFAEAWQMAGRIFTTSH